MQIIMRKSYISDKTQNFFGPNLKKKIFFRDLIPLPMVFDGKTLILLMPIKTVIMKLFQNPFISLHNSARTRGK